MTTICAVKHNGRTAIAGDGQVTMGEKFVTKDSAKKFAGFTAIKSQLVLPVALQMRLRYKNGLNKN